MKEETRRAIAHAVVATTLGKSRLEVYSYEKAHHTLFNSSGSGGYDHDAGAQITVVNDTGNVLFHHGTNSYIVLNVSGTNFSGCDVGCRHDFKGTVNGCIVQIYDFGEWRYFNYLA